MDRSPARHRRDVPARLYRRSLVETFNLRMYLFYAFIVLYLGSAAASSVVSESGPSPWIGASCAVLLGCTGYASIR